MLQSLFTGEERGDEPGSGVHNRLHIGLCHIVCWSQHDMITLLAIGGPCPGVYGHVERRLHTLFWSVYIER